MNEEELLNLGGNANDVTQAKDEAESKDKLYDEVDNLDRQAEEQQEPAVEAQEMGPWETFRSRARQLNEVQVDSEVQGIATDPKLTAEYIMAPPTGVLDTMIETYNMVMPGYDIPQFIPKFENEGSQFARDLSSVILPGMGWAKGLTWGGKALAAGRTGKLGAFLRDPFIQWAGTNLANMGGGALADLAAPVQGEKGSQTLLGTAKESFPRWTGWISDDFVVLDKDNTDVIRQKNLLEGSLFGATAGLIEGLGKMARGLKGVDNQTQWIPKNEQSNNYFRNKNVPEPDTVEEVVDAASFKVEDSRRELGVYNEYQAAARGELDESSVIFGRADDDILFSPQELGVRSTDDFGVVGGLTDQYRITNNIETVYGRVRNPMSEGALKFALNETGAVPDVMYQLGKQLKDAGNFDYRTTRGTLLTYDDMTTAADELVSDMMGMSKKQLQRVMGTMTKMTKSGPVFKNREAREVVDRVINNTLRTLADPDMLRAYALTETAFAGQVSDFAQQMRFMDNQLGSVRAQEQLLDRLEFLMDIEGTTKYASNEFIRGANAWERLTGTRKLTSAEKYAKGIQDQMKNLENPLEALELIQADTRNMMQSLRQIASERPKFLQPLALGYELEDGNIRSISALNNYLRNMTGVMKKAFIDGQPEIPSVMMNGFWSTAFNSALNGLKTVPKAAVGNLSTWVFKPSREIIGAFMTGDKRSMERAFYAYGNMMDTVKNANNYAKNMWVKSAQDPYLMRGRDEIVTKSDQQMELMRSFAEAAEAEGDNGPMMLFEIMQSQKDMAEHPWLRVGNRGMGTTDAWLTAVNGQQVSRMRAYDEVTKNGAQSFNPAMADEVARINYKFMFDEKGLIRDEQTLKETARMAFSQDNVVSTGMQEIMKRIPALKPFFMFSRTPVNITAYAAEFTPVKAFVNTLSDFGKPFEQVDYNRALRLLQKNGVDIANSDIPSEYNRLRNLYKGSAALGTSFVSMGVYGYLSGNITGRAGLYNQQKQKLRRDANWKPMTAFGVYYGDIPAVADWVSLTIDILDNAFEMESNDVGELLRTMGYVMGANLLEKTQLQNIEQFNDVLKGDPAAVQRWAANMTFTSTTKVGGMLGTMNQLMSPQLKAVENRFLDMYLNRVPGKPGLSDRYDYIDGGVVNELGNPLHRAWNAGSPFAYHEGPSETKQYLMDVEFDGTPGLSNSTGGAPYTYTEQQDVLRIMGEKGTYKRMVLEIKREHPAVDVERSWHKASALGLGPSVSEIDMVHNRLEMALQAAKLEAEAELPELIVKKALQKQEEKGREAMLQAGDAEGAVEFLEDMDQISH